MNKLRYTLIAALAAPLFALPYAAQAAGTTVQATASVVTPISVSQTAALSFGNIAPSATEGGTVTVSTGGSPTATGGVSLLGGTVSAGAFDVGGSGNAGFTITLPGNTDVALTGPGTNMAVTGFTSSIGTSGTLSGGSASFTIGATLSVGQDQTPGSYTGDYTVTVNYQ